MILRSQLFQLISNREGLPLATLEAMRAGLPLIGNDLGIDVGGIPEQIREDESGFHRSRLVVSICWPQATTLTELLQHVQSYLPVRHEVQYLPGRPSAPPQLGFRVVDLVKDPGAWGSLTRSTSVYPKVQLQQTISDIHSISLALERLLQQVPRFRFTPLGESIRQTLVSYGLLGKQSSVA